MRPWQRSALAGAAIGVGAALAFLAAHHLLVEPIWRATPGALAWGAFAGALAALLRARMLREPAFRHRAGGLLLGALAALSLAPFAIVGWMRSRAAPDPFALLILGLLVASFYHVTQSVQREATGGWRRAELFVGLLAANALPALVLYVAGDIHDEPPAFAPITLALAAIWLASGAAP